MNIGQGFKNPDGDIVMTVSMPFLKEEVITLRKVADKRSDRAPDYEIHLGPHRRIGALWKRTPKNGGDPFLSGTMESPAFGASGKIEVAVFAVRGDTSRPNGMDLVWRAPREQAGGPGAGGSAAAEDDEDGIPF